MKKILIGLVSLLAAMSLVGCESSDDNRVNYSDTVTTYNHVHLQLGDAVVHDELLGYYCYNSESIMIYCKTKNHGEFLTGIHNLILYTDTKCPLCGK